MKMLRGLRLPIAVGVFVLALSLGPAPGAAEPGVTTRVSVDSASNEGNSLSAIPAISGDGRFVVFQSEASNLVAGDTNTCPFFPGSCPDIFVHDRLTGATTRVSVDSGGGQANGRSFDPDISADGRFVAFGSEASNLVSDDTNNELDVFVHDRDADADGIFDEAGAGATATVRVSVDGAGNQGNGQSTGPDISADGRFVVFDSSASNLTAGDTNGVFDVFVHDRDADEDGIFDEAGAIGTTRASVDSAGNEGTDTSALSDISADGRVVTFFSDADDLVTGDTNGFADVFAHDRLTGATTRVSVDSAGDQGTIDSFNPAINADGRFITFDSASKLVAEDTNFKADVFVHDRDADGDGIFDEPGAVATTRVSVDSAGGQADSNSNRSDISAGGRFIAFESLASNLVAGDANGVFDVFVHDRGPLDSTPPVILPSRSPAPNAAGWNNTGDTEVSWAVSDPESGIASSTGCDTVTLTAETVGTTLTCSATNGGGLSSSATVIVRIDKTPPTISISTPEPFAVLPVGSALDFTVADALSGIDSVSAQLCDGASCDNVSSGFPPTAGVYNLTVEAVDVASNISTESPFFVIFDPDAGFATGGGWIIPGGLTSDTDDDKFPLPGLDNSSPAEFGFVVKYKPGATTPNGQLEFQYRQGNFNLHSSGIEWLVIVNNNFASFRGTASIQGMNGLFPFRVDARDSDFSGSGQPDRFSIKIWAEGANPDLDDPIHKVSGDLQGGSIIIHTR